MTPTRKPIYMDYNATTPVDPTVLEAMLPFLKDRFGNPSSGHLFGKEAKEELEKARERVASLISAEPEEVVFTSGGTESDNQAIMGTALRKGGHVITSTIEHPAVLETCRYLEREFGQRVTYLPVDRYGFVNPRYVEEAITKDTCLISIMHANNEVGTLEPLEEIGRIAAEHDVAFHTDAAQSCGKVVVDVDRLGVDLLTMAGHKLYAPKGVGALYVRRGFKVDGLLHGAGQENGRRAGTENVPYIVGLGVACDLARKSQRRFERRVRDLRDGLYRNISEGLGASRVMLNGHPTKRLPNTLNISIVGVVGEDLLRHMPELAASTGSACHSGSVEPSPVLLAMGIRRELARGALRLSLGRWTSKEEAQRASEMIVNAAARVRAGGTGRIPNEGLRLPEAGPR